MPTAWRAHLGAIEAEPSLPFTNFGGNEAFNAGARDAPGGVVGNVDLLGTANQVLAAASAKVYLLVAGIAVDCKALAAATAFVPRAELSLDREVNQ